MRCFLLANYNQPVTPASPQPLHAQKLARFRWLVHGFSTRQGGFSTAYSQNGNRDSGASSAGAKSFAGELNLGFTEHDRPANVRRNRDAFLLALGASSGAVNRHQQPWPLITLKQVHSDIIHLINRKAVTRYANAKSAAPSMRLVGDGMITNLPGVVLAVQAADCLPILLTDPRHHAIGVFHAGWRGTVQRIAAKGAGLMRLHFGTRFSDLRVAIGPGIGPCCYNVGEEVQERFESQFRWASRVFQEVEDEEGLHRKYPMLFLNQRAPGHGPQITKLMLDLAAANRLQLLELGVKEAYMQDWHLCTACNKDRFFSHRAEFGRTGRLMGAAALRP